MSKIEVDEIVNQTGDNDSGVDLSTNDVVAVKTANTERMRVDASGNVGIGTTSISNGKLVVSGSNGTIGGVSGLATFAKGSTGGGAIESGCNTAAIQVGSDGTNGFVSTGSNDMRLLTGGGERMRIDSSGRVLIGTTSYVIDTDQPLNVSASQACNMQATVASNDAGSVLNLKRSSNTQGDYIRLFNASGSETGQIRVDSGGTTQFENVSDYRLKDNIKDWDVDASAKVKQIKIKTFDWKDQTAVTNGKGLVGVIAHELQEVYPYCVSGEKDGYGGDVDKDGNKKPMYQGVDYGKLTPLLTKALQEAIAKIESLEARITALEGA